MHDFKVTRAMKKHYKKWQNPEKKQLYYTLINLIRNEQGKMIDGV